jgi:hypothetical protein
MKNILLKIKNALFSKNDTDKSIVDENVFVDENVIVENIVDRIEEREFTDEERERGIDEVYFAILSNDLNKMLDVTELATLPKHRHHLLQSIVTESYKLRKEDKYKNICLKFSKKHLEEFPVIAPNLINEYNTTLPRVSTFQYYSTLLSELEEYDEAIKTCEMAISFGLDDGTKGGYNGRIEKINKKRISIK